MNIEVVVNGKGVITINQKVDLEARALRKLTKHAVDLLTQVPGRGSYGFSAGAELDAEVAD